MRLWPATVSLAAIVAVISSVSPAVAQRPMSFTGTLQPCANGQSVRLEAGRRYTISASSEAFDTMLSVARRGSDEVLAQDDDGGGGNNSRLTFAPGESGDYLVCVSSFGGRGGGAYTLTVEPAAPLPPPVTEPTASETTTWQVYDGTLTAGDQQDGGSWFDDYQITLAPGQRALISLESGAFDTLLKVYRADQRGGEVVATDDDGGGGLNSFLSFAPDGGGTFIVRATSYSSDTGGAYRLRVAPMAGPPAPAP